MGLTLIIQIDVITFEWEYVMMDNIGSKFTLSILELLKNKFILPKNSRLYILWQPEMDYKRKKISFSYTLMYGINDSRGLAFITNACPKSCSVSALCSGSTLRHKSKKERNSGDYNGNLNIIY